MPPTDGILKEDLEVIYLKGSRIDEKDRYSYDVIYEELTEEGRQILFEKFHKKYHIEKLITLRCNCNPNEIIELIPVSGKNTYFLRTNPGQQEKHAKGCNFEGKYENEYYTNWKEDESTGKIHVRFKDSFVIEQPENQPIPENEEEEDVGERTPRERRNTFNRITLYGFFKRLLLDVWNVKMRTYRKALNAGKPSSYPDVAGLYESIEAYWANKIVFGKDNDLKRVLFSGSGEISKAAYSVKKNHNLCLMTLMLFEECREASDTHYILVGSHLSTNQSLEILCEKHIWDEALHSLREIDGPYLIGGWVTDTGYGKPVEFRSLAIIPISTNGVIVESSYERDFYNECHCQERQIIRPYNLKYYPNWNGMLPDGLFLDTPPETIVEIFGMSENQTEYHERKSQKIDHYSQLKENKKPFSFWYWEAYDGSNMPILPPKS